LPQDRVIVGVSGGPDSVALLCLLCHMEFPLSPIAVYIDHGLRPKEVITEIQLVEKLAEKLNVEHKIIRVDVTNYKQAHKISLEEAARILRYKALEGSRQEFKAKAIAIAHTADDQAEEILLRLIRGSGLKGLSGMRIQNDKIIRPLLKESKEDLISYLEDSDIPYCYDSSNSQLTFLRNRIRIDLLPFLEKKFNPAIRTNLLQTADILQQEEDHIDKLAEQAYVNSVSPILEVDYSNAKVDGLLLKSEIFLQHHKAIRRRVMEKICWKMEARPSFRQIEQLCDLAQQGKNGAELHLAKGLRILKSDRNIHFFRPLGKIKFRGNINHEPIQKLQINREGIYEVVSLKKILSLHYLDTKPDIIKKNTLLLAGDKITFPLILRSSEPGERFIPLGMKNRKKVNRFLSDEKIPRHTRHLHPVLVSGINIIAVIGLRVDQRYRIEEETTTILQVCWDSMSTEGE
jgi:tRNA(Ile)-lysidine synthase